MKNLNIITCSTTPNLGRISPLGHDFWKLHRRAVSPSIENKFWRSYSVELRGFMSIVEVHLIFKFR